jgi:phi LC3 family holin
MNWKIRFKNPHYVISLLVSLAMTVLAAQDLTAADMTTWAGVWDVIKSFVSNPYLIVLVLSQIYQASLDPTTTNFGDSPNVKGYNSPRKY